MRKSLTGRVWESDVKYTDKELADIAKKYNHRGDFLKKDRNAAKAARSRGKDFYNTIRSHMTRLVREPGTYTIAELRKRATAVSGGRDAQVGYVNVSAGSGGASINLSKQALFSYQLERDGLAASNNGIIVSLVATGAGNGNDAVGSMTWEEIT